MVKGPALGRMRNQWLPPVVKQIFTILSLIDWASGKTYLYTDL
jgi:hypothetical protein